MHLSYWSSDTYVIKHGHIRAHKSLLSQNINVYFATVVHFKPDDSCMYRWRQCCSLLEENGCPPARVWHKQTPTFHGRPAWIGEEVRLPHWPQECLHLLTGNHWDGAAPPTRSCQTGAYGPRLPADRAGRQHFTAHSHSFKTWAVIQLCSTRGRRQRLHLAAGSLVL